MYDTKCQFTSYPFALQQWPLEYQFAPQFQNPNGYQSTGVPQTFLSFSNMYNMIPAVSTGQASFTCSYGFHDQTGGPGSLQSPGQGYDYCVYPAARPSYYRSLSRRRNFNNSFRHSNHKNHDSNNYEIHTENLLNNFNQPEISLGEGHHLNKVNNTETNDNLPISLFLFIKVDVMIKVSHYYFLRSVKKMSTSRRTLLKMVISKNIL